MFSSELKMDFDKIPVSQNFNIRLLIRISAESDSISERPQLNLGIVLDRSGSMEGNKLSYVKMAASNLISRLAENDICSVTVFDDRIDVLTEPVHAGDIHNYDSITAGIEARGNTCLSGGFQKGFDLVGKNITGNNISRILLLTDGLANKGVTDTDALSGLSGSFMAKSVTTTTIGVGNNYDEVLMGAIAHSGGGNTYFIENPDDAPGIFQEELGYLISIAATDVSVVFTPKVRGLKVSQLNNYRQNGTNSYEIGDIYSGQGKILILETEIPPQHEQGSIDLADIRINYRDVNKDGMPLETVEKTAVISVVSAGEFSLQQAGHDVTLNAALLYIADIKSRMMKLANQGKFKEASETASATVTGLEALGIKDTVLDNEIQDLKIRAKGFDERGEKYYSPREKKRMYYESEMVLKNSLPQYDSMKSRRKEDLILKNQGRKYKNGDILEAVVLRNETPYVIVNLLDKRYDNEFRFKYSAGLPEGETVQVSVAECSNNSIVKILFIRWLR
ncbi:MAG: VWA domain-containing protein [Ignavibacteria bacterium]